MKNVPMPVVVEINVYILKQKINVNRNSFIPILLTVSELS